MAATFLGNFELFQAVTELVIAETQMGGGRFLIMFVDIQRLHDVLLLE